MHAQTPRGNETLGLGAVAAMMPRRRRCRSKADTRDIYPQRHDCGSVILHTKCWYEFDCNDGLAIQSAPPSHMGREARWHNQWNTGSHPPSSYGVMAVTLSAADKALPIADKLQWRQYTVVITHHSSSRSSSRAVDPWLERLGATTSGIPGIMPCRVLAAAW